MPASEHRIVATPPDDLPTVLARLLVKYHEAQAVADRDGFGFRPDPLERSTLRAAYLMAGQPVPPHLALVPSPAWA